MVRSLLDNAPNYKMHYLIEIVTKLTKISSHSITANNSFESATLPVIINGGKKLINKIK